MSPKYASDSEIISFKRKKKQMKKLERTQCRLKFELYRVNDKISDIQKEVQEIKRIQRRGKYRINLLRFTIMMEKYKIRSRRK